MMVFYRPLTIICFPIYCFYSSIRICAGCYPSVGYSAQPYYPIAMSARERVHADAADLNVINDEYPPPQPVVPPVAAAEASLDTVQTASELDCRGFDNNCRWSNTNEDELDWTVLMSTPDAEPWISTLHAARLPDSSAAVLLSSGGTNAWDAGQLVSDQLPCIVAPLQLTATVWRSASSSYSSAFPAFHRQQQQQPNLQICSRNVNAEPPNPNCNLFPVQNGIPVTVNVPGPRDPTTPAQIVLLGDNFIGPNGGAIFVQDIIVTGDLVPDCSLAATFGSTRLSKPLHQQQKMEQRSHYRSTTFQDPINSLMDVQELGPMLGKSNVRPLPPTVPQFAAPSSTDSAFAACLKLSCNPAEKDCGWHNGVVGWIKSTQASASANPLTGIMGPPTGTSAFLVASYNGDIKNSSHQIISPLISIPASAQPIYFCFYEYFALDGARFAMCVDEYGKRCFYSKIDMLSDGHLQESRRWNLKCVELPSGTYQIHVWAENKGSNKGEIGFVPLRVTSDPAGNDAVC